MISVKICALIRGNDADGTSVRTQYGVVGDSRVIGRPVSASAPFAYLPYPADRIEYDPGCGIENTIRTVGHDDYLAFALEDMVERGECTLPSESIFIVRFHSLFPWHSNNDYEDLENAKDRRMKKIVQRFSGFDLYSKSDSVRRWADYRNSYLPILSKYFPNGFIRF